jgi:hypothetical protein
MITSPCIVAIECGKGRSHADSVMMIGGFALVSVANSFDCSVDDSARAPSQESRYDGGPGAALLACEHHRDSHEGNEKGQQFVVRAAGRVRVECGEVFVVAVNAFVWGCGIDRWTSLVIGLLWLGVEEIVGRWVAVSAAPIDLAAALNHLQFAAEEVAGRLRRGGLAVFINRYRLSFDAAEEVRLLWGVLFGSVCRFIKIGGWHISSSGVKSY